MMAWLTFFFLLIGIMQGMVSGTSKCQASDCSLCIQEATCMWCSINLNTTSDMKRCISSTDNMVSDWRLKCGATNVIDPANYFNIIEDQPFSEGEQIIQLKPQHVEMDLRAKVPYRMTVLYKHIKNYPTDLYYLMDGSKSMNDDRETLSGLSKMLINSLKNITSDFRLGFGVFVEKPLMPYVTTVPITDPSQQKCGASPFGFHNALPLTVDTTSFENKVNESKTACNVDSPECGLDALMQVMVCKKEINWRNQSLRLIVIATDAGFHYAGDGKLGGIVTPNDMKCHLDSDGNYTHHTHLDYPSISQIHQVAKDNRVNLLFAITKKVEPLYRSLSAVLEGASFGILNEDSSNIVQLLTNQFSDIIGTVKLLDTANYPVNVKYFSSCNNNSTASSTCKGLEPGDEVKFEIEIEVESCSDLNHPDFKIYPEGRQEAIQVNITMLCQCKCEEPGDSGYKENDISCNYNGDTKCGVCICNEGYTGHNCECETGRFNETDIISDRSCRIENSSNICSGRGECFCGQCQCNKVEFPKEISGEFCQCTNYENCRDSTTGLLCSGNGECKCSSCNCRAGWTGDLCNCQDSEENCMDPDTGMLCSENGDCECNRCKCTGDYFGKFCEDCPECIGRCEELKSCVQCLAFETGMLSEEECRKNCPWFNYTFVPVAEEMHEKERFCTGYDDKKCRFYFVYGIKDGQLEVRIQEDLECPTPLNVLGIILGVLGIVVLIGLATLIVWKVLATLHDRREYAKFILDKQDAKWTENQNPIYKKATTVTQNPVFGKAEEDRM